MTQAPNSFTLELDTTPPTLEIISPQYTLRNTETEIIIQANEELALYQDIYIIDPDGVRHDFTFSHQGDSFYGLVTLSELPLGISTIYAQVKDEVHNLSPLTSRPILIVLASDLLVAIETKEFPHPFELDQLDQELIVGEVYNLIEITEDTLPIYVREKDLDSGGETR